MRRVCIAVVSGYEACRVLALFEVLKVGHISLPTKRHGLRLERSGLAGQKKQVERVPVAKHYGWRVGRLGL